MKTAEKLKKHIEESMGAGNNVGLAVGHLMIPEILEELEKSYRCQKIEPGVYWHFYKKSA